MVVDLAGVRRVVVRVDPVPGRGVAAVGRVRVVVGPGGGRDHGLGLGQEGLDKDGRVGEEVARREEGDGAVAEHAPGRGRGGEERGGEEEGGGVHGSGIQSILYSMGLLGICLCIWGER